MQERKAVHYGRVELIPGTICDGYVLDDGTPVMSLRGTADLLGMDHKTLKAVGGNSPPKTLKPFVTKGWSVGGNFVKVTSKTSPHCGREIEVYTTKIIRLLIHTYASAFINDGLRKNQKHIGKRAINLSISLVDTALDAVIIEACGLPVNIQAVAKDKYTDIVELLKESNFHCSVKGKDIAIKTDISEFLDVPLNTLNSYLGKHKDVIKPIKLDLPTIRTISPKANTMNGYCLKDVGTIALGMDSVIGIELKEKMFGSVSSLAKFDTKGEIEWKKEFVEVFAGLGFCHHHRIGIYEADFYVPALNLVLECNGYDNHATYDQIKEAEREEFISKKHRLVRFYHLIDWQTLVNGILRAILQPEVGTVIRLDGPNYIHHSRTEEPRAINVI
jgi:very-short-patch-repair endonuclease